MSILLQSEQQAESLHFKATPRAQQAAEEIVARWLTQGENNPLDRLAQAELRARHYLNSGERRWTSEAVYGTARFWRRQRWILAQRGQEINPANLIQLWRDGPGVLDADSFLPVANLPGPEHPRDFLRETLSFSDEMAAELETLLPDEALAAAAAFNQQAPTTLRVNTLRAGVSKVMEKLPDCIPTVYSPLGLELPRRVNLHELPGFREGWFELQEEASQLAALLCGARPGQTVVEVGAGAGGKTLALSAMMQNRGRLIALDAVPAKLAELEKRAKRAGAKNIQPLLLEADEAGYWQLSDTALRKIDKLRSSADCVLLDAPCTGSGVLRRNPDAKWRKYDVKEFSRLQSVLLEQASLFPAPGGVLIYSTCAFERAQNEAVIDAFLLSPAGQNFEIVPMLPRLQEAVRMSREQARFPERAQAGNTGDLSGLASGAFLRTWPHRHNMDAFFAACLRRIR